MVVCACPAAAMLRKSSCKASGETPCCSLDGGSGFGAVRPTSMTTPSAKSRNATSSACRWDASAGPRATEATTNPVTNLTAARCFIWRNSHPTVAWSTWKKITLPVRSAQSGTRLCGYTHLRRNVFVGMRAASVSRCAGAHPPTSASSRYACSWSLAETPGTKKVAPCPGATRSTLFHQTEGLSAIGGR